MNTIFLTVPVTDNAGENTEEMWNRDEFMEKVKAALKDERVRTSLRLISIVAPLAAGPMGAATGRILPSVAKGLKYAPHAINCVMSFTEG